MRIVLTAFSALVFLYPTARRTRADTHPVACLLEHPTIVSVTIYNRSRLTNAKLAAIVATANTLWVPYGVTIEPGSRHGIAVVISPDSPALAGLATAPVLGTTSFTDGHANPYIHLWLGAAEALAGRVDVDRRLAVVPNRQRDLLLAPVMGVALAHELAHYLLDTPRHAPDGLLQGAVSLHDLAHPAHDRLFLTVHQQQALCTSVSVRNLSRQ
ncbi:MAG TPA: hypothetical protein VFZ98_01690 [Vicinamibacterales bacterium]